MMKLLLLLLGSCSDVRNPFLSELCFQQSV